MDIKLQLEQKVEHVSSKEETLWSGGVYLY